MKSRQAVTKRTIGGISDCIKNYHALITIVAKIPTSTLANKVISGKKYINKYAIIKSRILKIKIILVILFVEFGY